MGRPPDCHCHCGTVTPAPTGGSCPGCPGNHAQYQTGSVEKVLVLQICNTNSSLDDSFTVSLNGTQIDANLDLGVSSQVGIIYKTHASVTIDDNDPLLLCLGQSHPQISIDANLLLAHPSSNVITSTQLVDNGAGNFGGIRVISYDYPYIAGEGCVVEDFDYGDAPWNYSFDLCETPNEVTLRTFAVPLTHTWAIRVDGTVLAHNSSYPNSVEKTAGDNMEFDFLSSTLTCPGGSRLVYSTWWVKVGSGAYPDWTDTGVSVFSTLNYTMPSDSLAVWPDHWCVWA